MVVNNLKLLSEIGFSEYEAKAYVALLKKNPAGAYELSKSSGIPSSKIYEVMSRLCERGAAVKVDGKSKGAYVPVNPELLVERYRSGMTETLDSLSESLKRIGRNEEMSYLRNINDYDLLMEECRGLIAGSRETVLLSGWQEDISSLIESIYAKPSKVKRAVVWFGEDVPEMENIYPHPVKDTLLSEKGGRQIVLCIDDRDAVIATVNDNEVQATISSNPAFAALARDYISHDVYILKVVNRFPELLEKTYGPGYGLLRDIFSDEVMK